MTVVLRALTCVVLSVQSRGSRDGTTDGWFHVGIDFGVGIGGGVNVGVVAGVSGTGVGSNFIGGYARL